MMQPWSPWSLYWDLEFFTRELWVTLHRIDNAWWPQDVTSDNDSPFNTLRQTLAAYKSTPGTTLLPVGLAVGEWLWSVSALVNSWVRLARAATKLRKACRDLATKAADRVATAATQRLVAACDKAAAFPRELLRLLRDTKATLKGINEASLNVLKGLVAKVAQAERLWEANARLAKDHLLGAVDDIIKVYFTGGCARPSACEVAEQCQRAIEDIPRLLRPPEHPQSVPNVSPVTMEPQEVSPPQLQVLVAVVATLGELLATMTGPHSDKSPNSLHEDLKNFTRSLRAILNHSNVASLGHPGVASLGRALATLGATPGTTRANGRAAAKAWRELVARLVDSWDWLSREATKLRDNHRKVIANQQLMVALDKEEVAGEMATYNAQVAAATNEAMGEAMDHLLRTLGVIDNILLSPYDGCGGPGGPGSCTVAKQCQKAIEDIPRLLQESFTWEH
ncbi:uncharacterized protein LOC128945576 [Melozone crissalis]|uniref:uncharacterized protein LOC128945576 n=1 Tax=Melozone crissalis TaxID=40204 RepID=UPI0023D9BD16|nr:uncharacterized protein LOC128945576 [Melozone crissalis]